MNKIIQLRLQEIKKTLAVPTEQADVNPDMWYEVFVTHDNSSTESIDSGDTFDEVAKNFEQHCKIYGSENLSIDIWQNREYPQTVVSQITSKNDMEFVSRQVSIKELVRYVDCLGTEGGGAIDVTGTWKGEVRTIRIEQTEWSETEVCLVGGYGNEVSALNPNIVSSVLDCVIGNYLDGETYHITAC